MIALSSLRLPAALLSAAVIGAISAVVVVASPAEARPAFSNPFRCSQTWTGSTRSGHSPAYAVDYNRTDDFGDAVLASAGGTVSRVENEGSVSYGLWIEIDHGGGWRTRYAHLSGEFVTLNASVFKGQQIGTVGSTGGSTGPHLHYEQRLNGSAVKIIVDGVSVFYYGDRSYTSGNICVGPAGTVNTAGSPLTVRSGTSTGTTAIGSVPDGGTIYLRCQVQGQSITGTYGTSSWWDRIGAGYVADAYVNTGSDGRVAPLC
ncbi:MAG TPA: peptidoglycan DD-metalloendopeptidase family protein [Micromonosporaceae bacterium]